MSTEGISEAELSNLTEEELAALQDDDDEGTDESGDDKETSAKDDDDKGADETKAEGDEEAGDDDKTGDDAGDEAKDDDDKSEADDNGELSDDDLAAIAAEEGEEAVDYEEKITSLDEEMDKVVADLDEGDINIAEYHKEMKRINNEITDLKIEKSQIESTERNNAKVAKDNWERDQSSFFENEDNSMYLTSKTRYDALNNEVKTIASDPKFQNSTGLQVLQEADKRIREAFTIRVVGKEDADDKGKGGKPGKKRAKIPQTLSGKPAADKDDAGKGEYDDLDALEGMDLEKALSKMSPEEQDRYARA